MGGQHVDTSSTARVKRALDQLQVLAIVFQQGQQIIDLRAGGGCRHRLHRYIATNAQFSGSQLLLLVDSHGVLLFDSAAHGTTEVKGITDCGTYRVVRERRKLEGAQKCRTVFISPRIRVECDRGVAGRVADDVQRHCLR